MAVNQCVGNILDLCFANGQTYGPHSFVYSDENQEPVDLSNYDIIIQFKTPGVSGSLIFQVPEEQIDKSEVAEGKFSFTLKGDDTKIIPNGSEWGIQMNKADVDPFVPFLHGHVYTYPMPANLPNT